MTPHLDRITRHLPLVPRTKPACPPLGKRLGQIRARAGSADTAAAALNLAALTASDTGMPDLARDLCLRQARIFLSSPQRFDLSAAQLALQPLINLARLRTRTGEGDRAHAMLLALFRAAQDRGPAGIEGLEIDFDKLTDTPETGEEIVRWLRGVMLSDGTRALASTGRWQEALTHVHHHHGIGPRILDGRQIAILAHSTAQEHEHALALIAEAETAEQWEDLVAAVLTVLCLARAGREHASAVVEMVDRYAASATDPDMAELFKARVGLCVINLATGSQEPSRAAASLFENTMMTHNAHVARELLDHPVEQMLSPQHRARLRALLSVSALGTGGFPEAASEELLSLVAEAQKHLIDLLALLQSEHPPCSHRQSL